MKRIKMECSEEEAKQRPVGLDQSFNQQMLETSEESFNEIFIAANKLS
jgi:hypothetical protein